MKEFWPYLKMLRPVKWHFAGAIFAGIIYGLASGFGLPFITSEVFPIIFNQAENAHFSKEARDVLSPDQMEELTTDMEEILTSESERGTGLG